MANPTLLTMPLCVNADKNTIPSTDAGTSGLFSEEYGWQNINSLPLASGGKAPNRRDFNGVFALLGGIAYACQRGQSFEWVNTLPYLAGCVVTDPLDGNKYNAKNDVPAGGSNPSLDPTNWEIFGRDPNALTREVTPAFNTRDIITTSGTYTAPVTGWYKITAKGGGGGGGGGISYPNASTTYGGNGGGEGGTTIAYVSMTVGDTATVVIGAGGAGGAGGNVGSNGGNTTVTIDGNTFTAGGGAGGSNSSGEGAGGTGTIVGCAGGGGGHSRTAASETNGGNGGGAGGGKVTLYSNGPGAAGTTGGGGGGGGIDWSAGPAGGGAGGDGYVWFEYFATI
jgi:hypothetical protein